MFRILRLLARLLAYRPFWLAAALVSWIGVACVPIVVGLLQQQIFDRLPVAGAGHQLVLLFLGFGVVVLVRTALNVLWFWVHHTFEPTIEALLRTNLVRWVIDHSGRTGRRATPVTLLGHVRDDVPGFTDLANEWYRIIGEAVFVVVALVVMLAVDPFITTVTFLPLAGVVLLTHWARTRLPGLVARSREATVTVTNFIGDVFGGVQTVQAAGAEDRVVRRLTALNRTRAAAAVRTQAAQAWIEGITEATVVAGSGLVLLSGANAMLDGRFTVGDFMLFATYLDWMLQLPRRLGRLLSQQRTSQQSVDRLQAALGRTPVATLVRHRPAYLRGPLPPMLPPPDRAAADRLQTLRVDGLTYHHPDGTDGIVDVSFALRRGTITVVTGELGSGKSTLLEVLLGLRQAERGSVWWNGRLVGRPGGFLVPPRVAYKPQLPRLFSESLSDNVRLGWPADRSEVEHALARVAFGPDLAGMPERLRTLVGPRGARLSGGQVQRIGAARMFVRGCQLYLIDDLSSALDDETEREIWEQIEPGRATDQATYLLVSHRAGTLRRADQILVLRAGRIWQRRTGQG